MGREYEVGSYIRTKIIQILGLLHMSKYNLIVVYTPYRIAQVELFHVKRREEIEKVEEGKNIRKDSRVGNDKKGVS